MGELTGGVVAAGSAALTPHTCGAGSAKLPKWGAGDPGPSVFVFYQHCHFLVSLVFPQVGYTVALGSHCDWQVNRVVSCRKGTVG